MPTSRTAECSRGSGCIRLGDRIDDASALPVPRGTVRVHDDAHPADGDRGTVGESGDGVQRLLDPGLLPSPGTVLQPVDRTTVTDDQRMVGTVAPDPPQHVVRIGTGGRDLPPDRRFAVQSPGEESPARRRAIARHGQSAPEIATARSPEGRRCGKRGGWRVAASRRVRMRTICSSRFGFRRRAHLDPHSCGRDDAGRGADPASFPRNRESIPAIPAKDTTIPVGNAFRC